MTFREMGFKEKIEHIWEYYKVHIGAGLALVFLIYSILNIYLFNPTPEVILDITVRIPQYDYEWDYQEVLKEALTTELITDRKHQRINIELLQTDSEDNPNVTMATEAKFIVKAGAKEFDIFIIDKPTYTYMLSQSYLMEIGGLEDAYNFYLPNKVKVKDVNSVSGEEGVYALDIKQMPGLAPLIIGDESTTYYATVFANSESLGKAMAALAYLSR